MCSEGDTGQECTVDFLSPGWVLCVMYIYCSVLVWCFQIVFSAKHAKWQHMVAIKWWLSTTATWHMWHDLRPQLRGTYFICTPVCKVYMKWSSYRNNEIQWRNNIILSECECTWKYMSVMNVHKCTTVNGVWLYIGEHEWISSEHECRSLNMIVAIHVWVWVYTSEHECTLVNVILHLCTPVHEWMWVYISMHEFTSVNMSVHTWQNTSERECISVYMSEHKWTWVYMSEHEWTSVKHQWMWVWMSEHETVYVSVHQWT